VVNQFQWQPFAGSFVAQSSTVTLVLKTGSYFTFAAAAYHDAISVVESVPQAVPTQNAWFLALVILAIPMLVAIRRYRLV
jgi:hypothetical protein